MAKDDDVVIEVVTPAGTYRMSPGSIANLSAVLKEEFETEMKRLGPLIRFDLKTKYKMAFAERKRIDGERELDQKISQAMTIGLQVNNSGDDTSIELGVFDWNMIDMLTRNQGKGTSSHGWFTFYEDGHEGRAHGSFNYGFIKKEEALALANQCAVRFDLQPAAAAEFVHYVEESFAGKHDQGIMVMLKKPLFKAYPDFGTAEKLGVRPHPGYEAFNVIANYAGPGFESSNDAVGNDRWIEQMADKVVARAIRRCKVMG